MSTTHRLVGLLAACLVSRVPVQAQLDWPADSVLIATAAALHTRGDSLSAIWPGYWPASQSFVLARPQSTALLVSSGTPGSEYVALNPPEVGRELVGLSYVRSEPWGLSLTERAAYDRAYRTGEVQAVAAVMQEGAVQMVSTLLHEGFHNFQRRHRWRPTPWPTEFPAYVDVDFNVLCEAERRVLFAALGTEGDAELRSVLMEYLILRTWRERQFPDPVREERALEASEGTARYVEARGTYAALQTDDQPYRTVEQALQRRLTVPDSIPIIGAATAAFPTQAARLTWVHRFRVYDSGAALGFLLDRLAFAWKPRIEAGEDLFAVTAAALRFVPSPSSRDEIDAILERYADADITEVVRALLAEP